MPESDPHESHAARQPLALAIFVAGFLLAYGALLAFIVRIFLGVAQARNAILLATFGLILAVRDNLAHRRVTCRISRHGTVLFAISLLVAGLWNQFRLWPLSILALTLALAALLSFVFGREGARLFFPLLPAFGVLSVALICIQPIDLTLRMLSAWYAASWLELLGIATLVIVRARTPAIVFSAGNHGFEVASECSGFGIILVSVVLVVMLSFGKRHGCLTKAGLLYLALLTGFAFNILRIVVIVALTLGTHWPYVLIHEAVGTLLFFLAITVVYGLAALPREAPTPRAPLPPTRGTVVDFRTVAPSRKVRTGD